MPTQATEPQELDKHPAAGDTTTSMRAVVLVAVVVVGDGQDKMMEVLAARAVEAGAARTTAEVAAMAVKETSAGRTAAVVVEDMEEEEGTDSNQEHTEAADTTHKARAAGTASKAKVVGTISKLKVVRTASNRRATIPTGNKAAMTPSLALEDWTPPTTSLLLEIPNCFVVIATFHGTRPIRSAREVSKTDSDGVLEEDFFRRSRLKSVFAQAATRSYPNRAEGDDVQAVCLTTISHRSGRRQTC
jgi:hypothetical protein